MAEKIYNFKHCVNNFVKIKFLWQHFEKIKKKNTILNIV